MKFLQAFTEASLPVMQAVSLLPAGVPSAIGDLDENTCNMC